MERHTDLEAASLAQMHRVSEAAGTAVKELAALATDQSKAEALAHRLDLLMSDIELAARVDCYAILVRLRPDIEPLYRVATLTVVDHQGDVPLNLPLPGLSPTPPRRSR